MTVQRMRQHIGAACWHFEQAAQEAPSAKVLPPGVRALVLHGLVVNLDNFGIDSGYVSEAADRETHLLPEVDDDEARV